MSVYRNSNSECQQCKEIISSAARDLNAACFQISRGSIETDGGCCWEKEYGIKFPLDPCKFASTYKRIIQEISKSDKVESASSVKTWNDCVKNNIEAVKLCTDLGSCGETPPGPRYHDSMAVWCDKYFPSSKDQTSCWQCISDNVPCDYTELETICSNMKDCRHSDALSFIDPPKGELEQCLRKFTTGNCCSAATLKTTHNMTDREKQHFWEEFTDSRTPKRVVINKQNK
mgnify:CR=1 FL=1